MRPDSSPLQKVRMIVDAAQEKLAEDLVALDVRGVVSFADALVIASGRSDRQVRSIADAVEQALKQHGDPPLGIEGHGEGRWVLMDCNDVVLHVFQSEVRKHYDLERLWSDAKEIELAPAAEAGAR